MPTVRSRISYSDQLSPPPAGGSAPGQPRRRLSGQWISLVALLLAVVIAGVVYFVFWRSDSAEDAKNQQQIQDLVNEVGRLIDLPTNETPTIATVSNLEALKGQEFFARAQVGDKVLIYPQARKAILYSPSKQRIIEVAPLNIPADNAGSLDLQKDDSTIAPTGSLQ